MEPSNPNSIIKGRSEKIHSVGILLSKEGQVSSRRLVFLCTPCVNNYIYYKRLQNCPTSDIKILLGYHDNLSSAKIFIQILEN